MAELFLLQELRHMPTAEEISEYLSGTTSALSTEEVEDILRKAERPTHLQRSVGEEGDSELGDFIEDKTVISPFEQTATAIRNKDLRRLMESCLSFDAIRVMDLRYGLNGETPRTLEEIGREFGITREGVRQIEERALKKLRDAQDARELLGVDFKE